MKILALDQASKTTGYAIFENSKLIDYGSFTVQDKVIPKRLVKIRNRVNELIDKHNIDKVILEDIQMQETVNGRKASSVDEINNVQTFKILAEVLGVIVELLEEKSIPYDIVLSNKWKSFLQIKGTIRDEQKRNAKLYVKETFNIDVIQDTCDAICIGMYALGIPRATKEVDEFDWSE